MLHVTRNWFPIHVPFPKSRDNQNQSVSQTQSSAGPDVSGVRVSVVRSEEAAEMREMGSGES